MMKKSVKLGLTSLILGLGLLVFPNSGVEAASKTNLGNGIYCGSTWESCEVNWGEYTQKAVDRAVLGYSTALTPRYGVGDAIHSMN